MSVWYEVRFTVRGIGHWLFLKSYHLSVNCLNKLWLIDEIFRFIFLWNGHYDQPSFSFLKKHVGQQEIQMLYPTAKIKKITHTCWNFFFKFHSKLFPTFMAVHIEKCKWSKILNSHFFYDLKEFSLVELSFTTQQKLKNVEFSSSKHFFFLHSNCFIHFVSKFTIFNQKVSYHHQVIWLSLHISLFVIVFITKY